MHPFLYIIQLHKRTKTWNGEYGEQNPRTKLQEAIGCFNMSQRETKCKTEEWLKPFYCE